MLKIGGTLALRSESMTKKLWQLLQKIGIYIMNEFNNGEHIFKVTRYIEGNSKAIRSKDKPTELTDEMKKFSIEVEIKKEEVKDYIKDTKLIKWNLKKVYTLVYGKFTESAHTMIKTDKEHEMKSKSFDHEWILEKVNKIVLGLDIKVNFAYLVIQQQWILCF